MNELIYIFKHLKKHSQQVYVHDSETEYWTFTYLQASHRDLKKSGKLELFKYKYNQKLVL